MSFKKGDRVRTVLTGKVGQIEAVREWDHHPYTVAIPRTGAGIELINCKEDDIELVPFNVGDKVRVLANGRVGQIAKIDNLDHALPYEVQFSSESWDWFAASALELVGYAPNPTFIIGDKVRITDGPYKGTVAEVVEVDATPAVSFPYRLKGKGVNYRWFSGNILEYASKTLQFKIGDRVQWIQYGAQQTGRIKDVDAKDSLLPYFVENDAAGLAGAWLSESALSPFDGAALEPGQFVHITGGEFRNHVGMVIPNGPIPGRVYVAVVDRIVPSRSYIDLRHLNPIDGPKFKFGDMVAFVNEPGTVIGHVEQFYPAVVNGVPIWSYNVRKLSGSVESLAEDRLVLKTASRGVSEESETLGPNTIRLPNLTESESEALHTLRDEDKRARGDLRDAKKAFEQVQERADKIFRDLVESRGFVLAPDDRVQFNTGTGRLVLVKEE